MTKSEKQAVFISQLQAAMTMLGFAMEMEKPEQMVAINQLILLETAAIPSREARKFMIETTCEYLQKGMEDIEKAGVCAPEDEEFKARVREYDLAHPR